VLVLVLGAVYHGQDGYGRLDSWALGDLLSPLHGHGRTLWRIVDVADPSSMMVGAGLLALLSCLLGAWRVAALAVVGLGATGLVVESLKHLVDRTLAGALAMPSGHTAGATALATVVALLVLGRVRRRSPRAGLVALLAVTAVAGVVGVTMTTLRLHYATDTLGGWGAGLAATLGVAFLVDAVAGRIRVPGARAAGDRPGELRQPARRPSAR
jgi:undecaprenyl-diphosphatase